MIKRLKEIGTALFWIAVIIALLALATCKGMADLGYRWGPGA